MKYRTTNSDDGNMNPQARYGRKWQPSNTAKKEFATRMTEIEDFCRENGISQSSNGDSYYFTIDGQKYRVSNHTVSQSNRGAYDSDTGEKKREIYHEGGEQDDTIYITAGKTRIIEIYNNLKAGRKLNRRGNVVASRNVIASYIEDYGDTVVCCSVCGRIAIGDKGEDYSETVCVDCGNNEWKVLPFSKTSKGVLDPNDADVAQAGLNIRTRRRR